MRDTRRPLLLTIASLLLAFAFVASGSMKLTGAADAMLAALGVPLWAVPLIGIVEIVGAVALAIPRTAAYGATALTVLMVGAVGTHVLAGDLAGLVAPAILGTIAGVLAWQHQDGRIRFRLLDPSAQADA